MKIIGNGIYTVENNDGNIYMIGDIHGDYQCLIHCLVDLCKVCKITKLYNDEEFNTTNREYLEWEQNNNSIIIFCGDIIHRKRFEDHVLDDECSDVFMLKTLMRLKEESKKYGGDIILVTGNHEIMNILNPEDNSYTSKKNISSNKKYFSDKSFVNEYVKNSYVWIKVNNILITHGGLCSDYLRYLDENHIFNEKIYSEQEGGRQTQPLTGNGIIEFVNDKYKNFFTNYDIRKLREDKVAYDLFVRYDLTQKNRLNLFWCREWGYSGVDCNKFKELLRKVDCNKMIIAHCPQFISPDYPKMINFECIDEESQGYNIARIDLGMSRCFDYNKSDNFMYYLSNNYNRKISVLRLKFTRENNNLYFDINDILTEKISCIQYLLIKYGITREEWDNYQISSDWLGFDYITKLLSKKVSYDSCSCNGKDKSKFRFKNRGSKKIKKSLGFESNGYVEQENQDCVDENNIEQILVCLLNPVVNKRDEMQSVIDFKKLFEKSNDS
jgi:hypothetical protein